MVHKHANHATHTNTYSTLFLKRGRITENKENSIGTQIRINIILNFRTSINRTTDLLSYSVSKEKCEGKDKCAFEFENKRLDFRDQRF